MAFHNILIFFERTGFKVDTSNAIFWQVLAFSAWFGRFYDLCQLVFYSQVIIL